MEMKYLENLRVVLINKKVPSSQVEDIIDEYRKTIELGLEAGVSYQNIIDSLGSIEQIASQYGESSKEEDSIDEKISYSYPKEDYTLKMALVSEWLDIKYHDELFIEVTMLGNIDDSRYVIVSKNNSFEIKRKVSTVFSRKENISIVVSLPRQIRAKTLNISVISGKINADELVSETVKIGCISGEYNVKRIVGKDIKLDAVSGNGNIGSIIAGSVSFNSLTGDLQVDESSCSVKFNTMTGKFILGHTIEDNVKDKIVDKLRSVKEKMKDWKGRKK